jgi:hypothetical protein
MGGFLLSGYRVGEVMKGKWILQYGKWFTPVETKEELELLLEFKKESRMQKREVWEGDFDGDIWQLEIRILLKNDMVLYGVMDDNYGHKEYPELDKKYGSCPRKRNKITFDMPLGLSVL